MALQGPSDRAVASGNAIARSTLLMSRNRRGRSVVKFCVIQNGAASPGGGLAVDNDRGGRPMELKARQT